jgi:hypothetical protein
MTHRLSEMSLLVYEREGLLEVVVELNERVESLIVPLPLERGVSEVVKLLKKSVMYPDLACG